MNPCGRNPMVYQKSVSRLYALYTTDKNNFPMNVLNTIWSEWISYLRQNKLYVYPMSIDMNMSCFIQIVELCKYRLARSFETIIYSWTANHWKNLFVNWHRWKVVLKVNMTSYLLLNLLLRVWYVFCYPGVWYVVSNKQ